MLDLGGTYRDCTPEETLRKIEPMLRDFGITRVANVTGLDNINLPTYVAIRPLSKLLTTSQGKGITHDLAKISAIMESIEGWHAENLPLSDLFGSYNQLKTQYNLIDIDSFPVRSFRINPEELKDFEFYWLKGRELNTNQDIYFPFPLVDLDFTLSHPCGNADVCSATSNGLASGNTYEEAVCHAIFEVIERHCWSKSQTSSARYLDLSSIKDPHVCSLLEHLASKDVRLEINDITNELNVPTYLARLHDESGLHAKGDFIGGGSHFSSSVALSRAITEAIQSRLTVISGSRDDLFPVVYDIQDRDIEANTQKIEGVAIEKHPFIATLPPCDFSQYIAQLLSNLNDVGCNQVVVYDHTRPDIGLSVVHVLIPGLDCTISDHVMRAYTCDQFIAS